MRLAEKLRGQHEAHRLAGQRISFVLLLVIPTTAAAGLAFHNIGWQPFWRDEAWSMSVADRSIPQTLEVLLNREWHMTLYYLLLNGWLELGSSEGFVRILSAAFAVAAVPVTVIFARQAFGPLSAGIAGGTLALGAPLAFYAQEARAYGLVIFLAALSFLLFVRAVQRGRPRDWGLYTITATAMVYSHILSILLVVPQFASLAMLRLPSAQYRYAARSLVALALVASPLIALTIFNGGEQASWIGPIDLHAFARNFASGPFGDDELASSRGLKIGYGTLFLLAVGQVVLILRRQGRSREAWLRGLVVLWSALPPLFLLAASFVTPLFVPRYVIGILPGLAVLAGATIAGLRPRALAAVATALLVITVVGDVATRNRYPPKGEDLRAAASLVVSNARGGDGVAYSPPWSRVGFGYYLERLWPSTRSPLPDLDMEPGGTPIRRGDVLAEEAEAPAVARGIMSSKRVWVVGYPDIYWDIAPDPVAAVGPKLFGKYFDQRGIWLFGAVEVTLYARTGSATARL